MQRVVQNYMVTEQGILTAVCNCVYIHNWIFIVSYGQCVCVLAAGGCSNVVFIGGSNIELSLSVYLHSQIISPLQSIGITLRAFIWMLILDSCGKFL